MKKEYSALALFLVGALVGFFPSLAKAGLFADATNSEIGLEVVMVWLAAIIIYHIPDNK